MKPATISIFIGLVFASSLAQVGRAADDSITVQTSQAKAVRLYPELGRAGSPMNQRFLKAFREATKTHDPILSHPDWPLEIANRIANENTQPSATPAIQSSASPSSADGEAIANALLIKYPKLKVSVLSGNTHPKPEGIEVDGSATSYPVAGFILPKRDWDALTKVQQSSLALYVESKTKLVQQHPENYIIISPSAPDYESELSRIRHIADDAWYIGATMTYPDDPDNFYLDSKLVAGDGAWDRDRAGNVIKASDLLSSVGVKSTPAPIATQVPGPSAGPSSDTGSVTVSGYFASPSEDLLDKAISYSVADDTAAVQEILSTGAVIALKGGIRVQIVDSEFFKGKVKIRPVGDTIELWTVAEAVK